MEEYGSFSSPPLSRFRAPGFSDLVDHVDNTFDGRFEFLQVETLLHRVVFLEDDPFFPEVGRLDSYQFREWVADKKYNQLVPAFPYKSSTRTYHHQPVRVDQIIYAMVLSNSGIHLYRCRG